MKYKVFDKITQQDITDQYDWVIIPDGELNYLVYGDLVGNPNAIYIIAEGVDESNESPKAVNTIRPRCYKCVYEMLCTKDKDDNRKCPNYKREAMDGGYYE